MISIGEFVFPDATTHIDSQTRFMSGRLRRLARIASVMNDFASRDAFREKMALLGAELERLDQGEAALSASEGRTLRGRRHKMRMETYEQHCLAVVSLEILAEDRFEYGDLRTHSASVASIPLEIPLEVNGNWSALPRVQFTASQPLSAPSVSDGTRTFHVYRSMNAGDVLTLDSCEGTANLNDQSILAESAGEFVELSAPGGGLVFAQGAGAPGGTLLIEWRPRWI